MPRRKQVRPTRMKYSEDGKVIKEEDDEEADQDGSSGEEDDDETDGDETQQSDDANDDGITSDNDLNTNETNTKAAKLELNEKLDEKVDSLKSEENDALEKTNVDISDKDMRNSDSDTVTPVRSNLCENMLVTATPGGEVDSPLKRKHSFEMDRYMEQDVPKNNYPSTHERVIDLSAKRPKLEHSSGEVLHSPDKPKNYQSSLRNSSLDASQPLDLSQKSSRKTTPEHKSTSSVPHRSDHYDSKNRHRESRNNHHESHSGHHDSRIHHQESRSSHHESRSSQHESRSSHHETRSSQHESRSSHHESEQHGTAISPSLASLQQKFGSNLGYWYNGGYPQFPHMNYVFSHLKVPNQYDVMQYDKRSLEGWYGKVMPSMSNPATRQAEVLKPVLPVAPTRPVSHASGVRRSPPSMTSSAPSSRPSANLPISKPAMNISAFTDNKNVVKSTGNCTDYKCDCGKTYSSLYELSVHMQETGHMPKNTKIGPSGDYPKLVRGQDMWLNSGSEQTKQILRCMQCGESFKSLPELTVHMMKTQHYADIFSSAHRKLHKCTTFFEKENDTKSVFKCRVCDTEYDTLDGLANHMVESKHHKKQGWRFQQGQDGSSTRPKIEPPDRTDGPLRKSIKKEHLQNEVSSSPNCVTRIKREIIENDVLDDIKYTAGKDESLGLNNSLLLDRDKNGDINHNETSSEVSDDEVVDLLKPCKEEVNDAKDFVASGHSTPSDLEDMGTIRCENCLERIHTDEFVEHVRVCISKKSASGVIGKLKAKLTARSRSCSVGDDECVSDADEEKPESKNDKKTSMNGNHDAVQKSTKQSNRPNSGGNLGMTDGTEKLPQKPGSALKAMEHFIVNFNEKRLTKSRHGLKARSLLYDVPNVYNYPSISPQVGNNYLDSNRFLNHETKLCAKVNERTKSSSDTDDRGRSPRGVSPASQNISPKLDKYERVLENENGGSALHSLYKFASMDPRKVAPKLRAKLDQKPDLSRSGRESLLNHSPQNVHLSPTQMNIIESDIKISDKARNLEKVRNSHSPKGQMDRYGVRNSDKHDMDETDCDRLQSTPSPGSVKSPYLHIDSPLNSKNNGSALDSLKGLVVKHMEKGEHPLNSLQKLINSTDGNHGPSITSLQSKLARNGPVWYSMSNDGFSPNKSRSPRSRSGSPVADRGSGVPGSALDLTHGVNGNSDHGSHSSDSDEETKPSDLKCDLCGKGFSSKGGCRYHRSKCPQNVPRGMGGREARIVRTPYMYMPPEHTNKFSKYYEMARELANKSK